MLSKKFLCSFVGFLGITLLATPSVDAETDDEGYEYEVAKASEIDFEDEDIFVSLIEGEPTDEDALYAVYTDEELEKYEKEQKSLDTYAATTAKSKGFDAYYKSSKWINRSDVISLSIEPKKYAWTGGGGHAGDAFKKKDRWDVLVKKHSGSKKWKNPASMKAQLNCHVDFAKSIKTPWNLEPHRTTTNYAAVVKAKCNPK